MTHQTAGGVLFSPDLKKVYLIYKTTRDEFLLPKGHVEDDESLIDTAKREIYEETGYKNFLLLGAEPLAVNKYKLPDGDTKIVRFFIAVLVSDKREMTKWMKEESLGGHWFKIDEAIKRAKYDDIKLSIKKARDVIQTLRNSK